MKSILDLEIECNDKIIQNIIEKRKSLERINLTELNYFFNKKNSNLFTKDVFNILELKKEELIIEIKNGFEKIHLPELIKNSISKFKSEFEENKNDFYNKYTASDNFTVFKSGKFQYNLSSKNNTILKYNNLYFTLIFNKDNKIELLSARYQNNDSITEIIVKHNIEKIFSLFDINIIEEHIKIMKLLYLTKLYLKKRDKKSYDYFVENFYEKPLVFENKSFKDKISEVKEIGLLYDLNIISPKIKEYLK